MNRSAHDLKHLSSSVKHFGGRVMAWDYKAASGTVSLIFSDGVTDDHPSRINPDVSINVQSATFPERCIQS